jgi:hypothetical protein
LGRELGESGGLFGVSFVTLWQAVVWLVGEAQRIRFADFGDLALRIILLIWGSFIPSIFYGFGGDMEMVRVYWVMVGFHAPFSSTIISAGILTHATCRSQASD